MAVCPACGQPVDAERLIVDLQGNQVTFHGQTWDVQPKLAEFLYCLWEAYPNGVADNVLGDKIWGPHEADHKDPKNVMVYASKARERFSALGMDVLRCKMNGVSGYKLQIRRPMLFDPEAEIERQKARAVALAKQIEKMQEALRYLVKTINLGEL